MNISDVDLHECVKRFGSKLFAIAKHYKSIEYVYVHNMLTKFYITETDTENTLVPEPLSFIGLEMSMLGSDQVGYSGVSPELNFSELPVCTCMYC